MAQIPFGRIEAAINNPAVTGDVRARLPQDFTAYTFPSYTGGARSLADLAPPELKRRAKPVDAGLQITAPGLLLRRKPDEFYSAVAELFSRQSTISDHPAPDLAAANGVPVTTVHRWLKEARRRGLLAPARRQRREQG